MRRPPLPVRRERDDAGQRVEELFESSHNDPSLYLTSNGNTVRNGHTAFNKMVHRLICLRI